MVRHLFRDYLHFADQFEGARAYWLALVEDVAAKAGQFDARSERLARAVRILQGPPESADLEISGWMATFDYSAAGGPGPTDELVINVSLSEESAAIARTLLTHWMDATVSPPEMKRILKNALAFI